MKVQLPPTFAELVSIVFSFQKAVILTVKAFFYRYRFSFVEFTKIEVNIREDVIGCCGPFALSNGIFLENSLQLKKMAKTKSFTRFYKKQIQWLSLIPFLRMTIATGKFIVHIKHSIINGFFIKEKFLINIYLLDLLLNSKGNLRFLAMNLNIFD